MSISFLLAITLALGAPEEASPAAPAPPAAASDAPRPTEHVRAVVHLRDGGLVRGTVKKLRLGKSITLSLQSGKSMRIDDEDIVEIQIFGHAAPADASASDPEAATAPSVAGRPASVPAAAAPPVRTNPSSQPAPASELDTVYLADGGVLRGTLESEKPDLVLRLLSGRTRTIAAKDVKSISRRGAPHPTEKVDRVERGKKQ